MSVFVAAIAVAVVLLLSVGLPVTVGIYASTQTSAGGGSFSDELSCTVSAPGGSCQVTTTARVISLTSVTQTSPVMADKTGDTTVGGDGRTLTIINIDPS
jgi:hypothetical protein